MSASEPEVRNNLLAKVAVLFFLAPLLVVGLSSSNSIRMAAPEASPVQSHGSGKGSEAERDLLVSASVDASSVQRDHALSLTQERIEEVELFLKAYKLDRYSSQFVQALTTGGTDEIAEAIPVSTGLKLVSLGALPDGVERYPVLKVAGTETKDDQYLLFWRPVYYFYRDIEVKVLQGALRRLGHYQGDIDGLAGPLTRMAIRSFQDSVNLPPSGTPETATLFLLGHFDAGGGPSNVAGEVSTGMTLSTRGFRSSDPLH